MRFGVYGSGGKSKESRKLISGSFVLAVRTLVYVGGGGMEAPHWQRSVAEEQRPVRSESYKILSSIGSGWVVNAASTAQCNCKLEATPADDDVERGDRTTDKTTKAKENVAPLVDCVELNWMCFYFAETYK